MPIKVVSNLISQPQLIIVMAHHHDFHHLTIFDHIWPYLTLVTCLLSQLFFSLCLRYMPPLAPSAPYRDNPNRSDELLPAEDPLFEAPSHHAGEALGWGYRHGTVDGSYSSGWVYQLTSIRYLSIWTWWIIAPLISGSCVSHSYCISLVPGVLSAISPSQLLSWILYISIFVGNTDGNCFFSTSSQSFFPFQPSVSENCLPWSFGNFRDWRNQVSRAGPSNRGTTGATKQVPTPRRNFMKSSDFPQLMKELPFFIAPRQTKIQRYLSCLWHQHPLFPRPSM